VTLVLLVQGRRRAGAGGGRPGERREVAGRGRGAVIHAGAVRGAGAAGAHIQVHGGRRARPAGSRRPNPPRSRLPRGPLLRPPHAYVRHIPRLPSPRRHPSRVALLSGAGAGCACSVVPGGPAGSLFIPIKCAFPRCLHSLIRSGHLLIPDARVLYYKTSDLLPESFRFF
jgi:hypothetical protein